MTMPRLIDADALLERFDAEFFKTDPTGEEQLGFLKCRRIAREMPTIDAEPVRHGRWILKAHDEGINYRWNVTAYCSECCDEESEIWAGFFPGVPDFMVRDVALDSAKTVKLSNYCPNCGAKMMEA